MNIKIKTKNGLDLQYYDHRDTIFVEKLRDGLLLLQWYDEYNEVSDSRAIFDTATLELSND